MSQVIFPFKLMDGTTISIQASAFHYCHPRTDEGPWKTFETMPNVRPEDEDYGISAGATPEEILKYVNAHGGFDFSDLVANRKRAY